LDLLLLATIPAFIFGVARARSPTDDAARELSLARRQELLLCVYLTVKGILQMLELTARYDMCIELTQHGATYTCTVGAFGSVLASMAILHLIIKPLLRSLAVIDGTLIAATMLVTTIFSNSVALTDILAAAALLIAAALVFTCDSYVRESAERQNFVEHATLLKASLQTVRLSEQTRAVVAASMPKELVALGAGVPTEHHSDYASVGICDIADFANWSCGLLIENVVASLHDLMLLIDLSATLNDVVNVLSYGDSCVVCAGLVTCCDDHADRVRSFGEWILEHSAPLPFHVRFGMSSGELMGGLVGESSMRYVVAGPAFSTVRASIFDACNDDNRSTPVDAAHELQMPLPAARYVVTHDKSASMVAAAPDFSNFWLSFSEPEAQRGLLMAEARNFDASKRLLSAIPVAVFAMYLFVLLVELAREDDHRNPYPLLSLLGTAIALALTLAVAAMRRFGGTTAVPLEPGAPFTLPLDFTMYFVAFAVGAVASELSGSTFVNGIRLLILLGCPNLFSTLPWIAQLCVVLLSVVAPTIVSDVVSPRGKLVGVSTTGLVFALIKYHGKRVACQHYAAEAAAQLAVDRTCDETARYEKLLAGLLPPHAVVLAGIVRESSAEARGRHVRRQWRGLSVLQVQLCVDGLHDVAVLAAAWSSVAGAVRSMASALLETVETSGDSFLIAGPFYHDADDEVRVDAAREVLRLLANLKNATVPHCLFTAVATAGSAYGALIGLWGLTFRFFGPVVRESNAVLAAAPIATAAPLAFATAGFRQQHANFGVPARPPRRVGERRTFAMSLAVATESMYRDTHAAVSGTTPDFGAAANWRIRGVGVARVSAVRFSDAAL
jgi:hypothetical protein